MELRDSGTYLVASGLFPDATTTNSLVSVQFFLSQYLVRYMVKRANFDTYRAAIVVTEIGEA